jgi:hypothetical protein
MPLPLLIGHGPYFMSVMNDLKHGTAIYVYVLWCIHIPRRCFQISAGVSALVFFFWSSSLLRCCTASLFMHSVARHCRHNRNHFARKTFAPDVWAEFFFFNPSPVEFWKFIFWVPKDRYFFFIFLYKKRNSCWRDTVRWEISQETSNKKVGK